MRYKKWEDKKPRKEYWGNNVLSPLTKVMYVIRMNQFKMTNKAKRKWLNELKRACTETLEEINYQLEMMEREENAPF